MGGGRGQGVGVVGVRGGVGWWGVGGGQGQGVRGGVVGSGGWGSGGGGGQGVGVVGSRVFRWGSRCHLIDRLPKLWLLHFKLYP